MDALEFILIIAVFAVVLHWYLKNAEAKSEGGSGLLALTDDPVKNRRARRKAYRPNYLARDGVLSGAKAPPVRATYRLREEGERMRRRFRRQDEARYRVKDKAASYKLKP